MIDSGVLSEGIYEHLLAPILGLGKNLVLFWPLATKFYTFNTELFGVMGKNKNMNFCTDMYKNDDKNEWLN